MILFNPNQQNGASTQLSMILQTKVACYDSFSYHFIYEQPVSILDIKWINLDEGMDK